MKNRGRYRSAVRSTVYALAVVAAISVLVATLWMPVYRTYGHSMNPTLSDGDIVVSIKSVDLKSGDLVAFYIGNKLLIKRVIALPGDIVEIDESGLVTLNGEKFTEDYIVTPSQGTCNIEFPFTVPESSWFVMGDNRESSIDSRNTAVGCVYEEQIVGKVIFRVWPLKRFGTL